MKRRIFAMSLALVFGVLALVTYYSGYQLRLVPNEPDLRPRLGEPSPLEQREEFQLQGGSERRVRGFPQRKIIDLVSLFPDSFFREGPTDQKVVALTFDDGPDSVYTPQIMDVLKEHKIKATFFLIGNRAELFPEVIKRMVKEGHVVGNHTMNHPDILKLNQAQTEKEIMDCEQVLAKYTGYNTALFRSPYGSLDPDKVRFIKKQGYKIIAWNVDSLDWKSLSAEQVKYNILDNVREGSIILQHSSGGKEENLEGTVAALPEIIEILRGEGYKFVTVPELLDIRYKK